MFELVSAASSRGNPIIPDADLATIFAILCLFVALAYLRRALVPIGPLLRVAAAAAIVALAVGAAVVLLITAAIQRH
jgi:hypothetical protein